MKTSVNLIFPHQLFASNPILENGNDSYLIEEFLFFRLYDFHRQKIAFHRASMKSYQKYLEKRGLKVHYIESGHELSDIRNFHREIENRNITAIHCLDPVDNWLEKRIRKMEGSIELKIHETSAFINQQKDISKDFKADKKTFFQTSFYKNQRKKRKILVEEDQNPVGGDWTYDKDNRKKYPKGKTAPTVQFPASSEEWREAVSYVKNNFESNPGQLTKDPLYPIDHQQAEDWLTEFLKSRFHEFGPYEDAIVKHESWLNHSVLSPLINVGLLLPEEVISKSLRFALESKVPINSTEGFIRQVLGWREFIRGMYLIKGSFSRTNNFWGFSRKMPRSFYDGTTGIEPVDHTIKKVMSTGYCHHIERLMILGNFMLLCEIHPDEVYRWFMELFIDAYDWVMVPNVYGMSQFADGGLFATKPYIGASNYLRKMSDYPSGDWEEIWDGLFWRFISKHRTFFESNPRLSMMYHTLNRMDEKKKNGHLEKAENFLKKLN